MTQIYIGPSGKVYQLEAQSPEYGACTGCAIGHLHTALQDCKAAPCEGKVLRPLSDGAKQKLRQAMDDENAAAGGGGNV